MKSKSFKKEYIAILSGSLESQKGTINAPIARKEGSIIERCVCNSGDVSISHYEVLKHVEDNTLVRFILETGRTHQLRVHSKHLGHPILGDTLYGKESNLIARQALHSYKASFIHPISKTQITHTAEIPEDISAILT